MREIIFRGKRTDNGEMWYGDLSHHTTGKVFIKDIKKGINGTFEVVFNTIGQFTGRHDKYNTPIYEGDVLEIRKFSFEEDNPETQVGDVFWHNGAFRIREIYSSDGYDEIGNVLNELCSSDGIYNTWSECKVIGNIHDNLELIKE